MREVQVPVDEVIGMVPMGESLMAAPWAVDVIGRVARTGMASRAGGWVLVGHLQNMFVDMFFVGKM